MSVLGEIGRRKVSRVAAVYAVVAWLIVQVVGEIAEPLSLPSWLDTTVIVLLAIGFPIVLILAWVFDLTPAGVRIDSGIREDGGNRALAPIFTYVVQGLVLVAVGFLVIDQYLLEGNEPDAASDGSSEPVTGNIVRFTVPLGANGERFLGGEIDTRFGRPASTSIALSNDGTLLVYAAWTTGADGEAHSQLYLRRLDQESAAPIVGTEGGYAPFFFGDDAGIGFFAGSTLKRVSLADRQIETLVADADVPNSRLRGVSPGPDATVVYGGVKGLYRVAASGGTPELIVDAERPSDIRFLQPIALPGGQYVLFHSMEDSQDPALAAIHVRDLVTGNDKTLLTNAMDPRYVASTGHLLFMRQGSLLAVRFDVERAELIGEPVVVLEDVMQAVGMPNGGWETGAAQLALSPAGQIAFASGGLYPENRSRLMRVDPDGTAEPLISESLPFNRVRASPNREQLAIEMTHGRGYELHTYDLTRGVMQQLNAGVFSSARPIWSPDGSTIMFETDNEAGVRNIYRIAADGSGAPEQIAPSPYGQVPASWSATGVIAYLEVTPDGHDDIWIKPPNGAPVPFVTTPLEDGYADFSPDGRWLVYASGRADRRQVYVQAYPGPGPATQISSDNGHCPAWSPDGRQLYFLRESVASRADTMMVVEIESTAPFRASRPRTLIDAWPARCNIPTRDFDVLADGSFVVPVSDETESGVDPTDSELRRLYAVDELHVILNFTAELRRRATN